MKASKKKYKAENGNKRRGRKDVNIIRIIKEKAEKERKKRKAKKGAEKQKIKAKGKLAREYINK